jgi:hypothetical protein
LIHELKIRFIPFKGRVMKKILSILKEMNFKVYPSDKYNVYNYPFIPYQDEGEAFKKSKIENECMKI